MRPREKGDAVARPGLRAGPLVVQGALAAAILALVLAAVDTAAVGRALRNLAWEPVALALAIVQVQIALSAARWRYTAGRLGQRLRFGRALAWYYEASLLNLVLPAGVLGDGFRAYRAGGQVGVAASLKAVALERMSGQAAFLLVAASGLALWPPVLRARLPEAALHAIVLVVAAAVAVAATVAALALRRSMRARLAGLGADLRCAFYDDGAWAVQAGLSLAIVSSYIAVFALATRAVGVDLSPVHWFTVIPLVLLTMLVPVSIGGWGLREAASAALWPVIGLAAADGVAAALVYGLVALAGSAPGAVSLIPSTRRA